MEPAERPDDIEENKIALPRDDAPQHDEVFGEVTEDGPNFRGLGWKGTVVIMMKLQIGLGLLSLPQSFHNVGMIPAVILLVVVASITGYSSWTVGMFKLRHPEVYGIDDAGNIMFGRIGRELLGTFFCLYWIFISGSGILGASIALNSITMHGTCTAVFVAIVAVAGGAIASVRTLSKVSWLAWTGVFFLLSAVFTVTIAVGLQDRPAAAPPGPWSSDFELVRTPTFSEGMGTISTFIFSCSATPAYFAVVAEMRDPTKFTRSLVIAQSFTTALYVAVGVVIYYYCGTYVASPALGSAGALIKRVGYGIALPGLLITTGITVHFTAKYVFVRLLRGTPHLSSNSPTHWLTWLGCTGTATIVAYVIASGIPIFSDLVSLVGAFLGASLVYHPAGCMWLYDNWSRTNRDWSWRLMASWSIFLIVIGTFLTVGGTYGAVVSIMASLRADGASTPWGCGDNSNSV